MSGSILVYQIPQTGNHAVVPTHVLPEPYRINATKDGVIPWQ